MHCYYMKIYECKMKRKDDSKTNGRGRGEIEKKVIYNIFIVVQGGGLRLSDGDEIGSNEARKISVRCRWRRCTW